MGILDGFRQWLGFVVMLFDKGGIIMWPLLLCSFLGLALIIERTAILLWITVRFRRLVDKLRKLILARKLDEASKCLGARKPGRTSGYGLPGTRGQSGIAA